MVGVAENWVASWACGASHGQELERDGSATIRNAVRITAGGRWIRVRVCNVLGEDPLVVGRVTVALQARAGHPGVVPGSLRELRFGGERSLFVAPGTQVTSDAVEFEVGDEADLLVTLFALHQPRIVTLHKMAPNLSFLSLDGPDLSDDLSGAGFTETTRSWRYLAAVEVAGGAAVGAVAVLGGSLSTGYPQSADVHAGWPDHLARRLLYGAGRAPMGLASVAVGGNRLLRDGFNHPDFAPNERFPVRALRRIEWDLLPLAGLRSVIVLAGTTDMFQEPHPGAGEILAGLRELTGRLRGRGLNVVGATFPPRWNTRGYTPEKERVREEINRAIRAGEVYRDWVDFDAVLRSAADPRCINPAYNSGDHVHPNIDGHLAVASAVDVGLLHAAPVIPAGRGSAPQPRSVEARPAVIGG